KILKILGVDDPRFYDEKTCNWNQTWDDNMGQDRARMSENWSGLNGVQQEDAAMSLSMGPIVDRTEEHLVPADLAVVTVRRMLMAAARAVTAGGDPIGVSADLRDVRALDRTMTMGESWKNLCPGHWLKGGASRGETASEPA